MKPLFQKEYTAEFIFWIDQSIVLIMQKSHINNINTTYI